MKLSLVAFSLLLSFSPVLAVGPLPGVAHQLSKTVAHQLSKTTGSTALKLSSSFTISLSGVQNPPSDLSDAVTHTINHLQTDKLQALVSDPGTSSANLNNAASLDSLVLTLESGVKGFTLNVPADGSAATLQADSALGLSSGLTEFEQLWLDFNGSPHLIVAPIVIVDR